MTWPVAFFAAVCVACFTVVLIVAMIQTGRIPWMLDIFILDDD